MSVSSQDGFQLLKSVLHPIPIATWGELAIKFYCPTVGVYRWMLVQTPEDFDLVVQKLLDAGFIDTPWSYTTIDPEELRLRDAHTQEIHKTLIPQYEILDRNSVRLRFPMEKTRLILLKSDYVNLCPPHNAEDPNMTNFVKLYPDAEIYCPNIATLLESLIRTLLKDKKRQIWVTALRSWVLGYLYHLSDFPSNILDECDTDVKEWFHSHTKPYEARRGVETKYDGRVVAPKRLEVKAPSCGSSMCA